MKPVTKGLVTALLASMLAAAVFVGTAGAAGGSAAVATGSAGCTAATNIEAILDDSGSMEITDPNKLRVQAMDLLIKTLPSTTTLGGVEFGSGFEEIPGYLPAQPAAFTIFPPEPIGPNAATMEAAMATNIKADNGATDYNGAFAKADADNPTEQARIFLTDGGHDEGTYNEAHLAHPVPTYVIGFGLYGAEDTARLKKIATDTGGQVYELKDDSEVQAVVNKVGAALTCQTPPRQFTDELSQGQSKTHSITVGAKTKTLRVTLTWSNPGDAFKLTGLRIKSHGKIVAAGRPKPASHIQVSVAAKSSTFTVLNVSHLRPGSLLFGVKGAKVAGGTAKVTTQVGGGS